MQQACHLRNISCVFLESLESFLSSALSPLLLRWVHKTWMEEGGGGREEAGGWKMLKGVPTSQRNRDPAGGPPETSGRHVYAKP